MKQKYYVAIHNSNDIWKRSSSGGAFTAITDAWVEKYNESAVVYGCVFDENLNAVHIRTTTKVKRDRMCGSKYIQSNIAGIFKDVENDLNNGLYVCFSGTPCQIAGLKKYLECKKVEQKEYLLTIEVICHGVGSIKFFKDYIKDLEKKYKGKAFKCNFRTKRSPEKRQDMEVVFNNGKRYNASSTSTL